MMKKKERRQGGLLWLRIVEYFVFLSACGLFCLRSQVTSNSDQLSIYSLKKRCVGCQCSGDDIRKLTVGGSFVESKNIYYRVISERGRDEGSIKAFFIKSEMKYLTVVCWYCHCSIRKRRIGALVFLNFHFSNASHHFSSS